MQTLLDLLVTMEEVLLKSSNQTANLVTGDGIGNLRILLRLSYTQCNQSCENMIRSFISLDEVYDDLNYSGLISFFVPLQFFLFIWTLLELDNSEDEEIASSDDDVGLNEKGCTAHASSSVLDEQEENSDGATSNDDPAIDRRYLLPGIKSLHNKLSALYVDTGCQYHFQSQFRRTKSKKRVGIVLYSL